MKYFLFFAIFFVSTNLLGQSSLNPMDGDETLAPLKKADEEALPGDRGYPSLEERIKTSHTTLRQALSPEDEKVQEQPAPEPQVSNSFEKPVIEENEPEVMAQLPKASPEPSVRRPPRRDVVLPSGVTVFRQNFANWEEEVVLVPALSSALGKVMFGEEVTASQGDWVAVKLDYAFLGPNGAVVELTGCRLEVEATANFHTSTVKGRLKKLVCTSSNGKPFIREVDGKIVSAKREYGGVKSDVIMAGPAKGMALEALQAAIKGFGEAMAFTESTRSAVSNEFSTSEVENVSGSKERYIGGKVAAATGSFLDYVVKFYKGLEPSLALAPGTIVHVVIRDQLEIPHPFFKSKLNINKIKQELEP